MLGEEQLERLDLAGGYPPGVEQQRFVERVEQVDAADRDGAEGVAVVSILEADEARALRLAALSPPLERHLQRDLDGRRAAVGVEHPAQTGRRKAEQPLGQLDRGLVGEAEHGRVGDAPELSSHGGIQRRMPMTVDVAPQRRDAIDVDVAVGVVEVGALGAVDDQRRLLLTPAKLLGERMPEDPAIGGREICAAAHARKLERRPVGTSRGAGTLPLLAG